MVGFGYWGPNIVRNIVERPEFRLMGLCELDPRRASDFTRRHPGVPVESDLEQLLLDPRIRAVAIATPPRTHHELARRALEAGKHVLCEKPLSRHADEVERAFDVAEREGRLLMEAFMYRHNPQTRRLSQLVTEGAVGTVRMIRAAFSFHVSPGDIRLRSALDGGALMDVGCYCVSGARLIAGEPARVTADQLVGGEGVDIAFTATMRFGDGVLAHFDGGLVLAERDELEVVGENGVLFLDDPWHCRTPLIELRREDGVQQIRTPVVDSYRLEAENFSASIRGEAQPLLGRADAVGQARAIEALYAAAESGRAVTL